jgi:VCBS repeat-containing protein
MKFFKTVGSLAACAALTGATLLFNVPRYSIEVQAAVSVPMTSTKIVDVACGLTHTLMLDSNGNLYACGSNAHSQLGDGTTVDKNSPVQIMAGHRFSKISAGSTTSAAIDCDGYLYIWGQLLTGGSISMDSSYTTPHLYSSTTKYSDVTMNLGGINAMAITGTTVSSDRYVGYSGHTTVAACDSGSGNSYNYGTGNCNSYNYLNSSGALMFYGASHSPATTSYVSGGPYLSADTYCVPIAYWSGWTYYPYSYSTKNDTKWVAIDSSKHLSVSMSDSIDLSSVSDVTFIDEAITKNGYTGYAVSSEGNIYSFGQNINGVNLLGDSTTISMVSSLTPIKISTTFKAKKVFAGLTYAVALSEDGDMYSWGSNGAGQLGCSGNSSESLPTLVSTFVSSKQFSFTSFVGETFDGTFSQSGASNYAVSTAPTKGTMTLQNDGSFTYVPNSGTTGFDSAAITFDISGVSISKTVTIKLDNKPLIYGTSASIVVNSGSTYRDGISVSDLDGDVISYSCSKSPLKGTITIDNTTGVYVYTPNSGAAGADSFELTVSDGAATDSITVSVHIETIISCSDSTSIVIDNSLPTSYSGNMGASDADGDTLTYSVGTSPAKGTLTLSTDGTYVYTPVAGSYGSDSFSLTVTDGVNPVTLQYSVVLYTIKDSGTITDHTISTGSSFNGEILTSFQNVTPVYSISTAPKKGTVNIDSATGKYTYSALSGFAGSDSFIVSVDYGYGKYIKTINVYLDTAPDVSAVTKHITTNQGVSYTGSAQATDVDPSAALTYSISEEPTKGSVSINEHTGAYTYVPLASSAGDDSFTADVSDGINIVHVVVGVHIETAIATNTTINKVTSQNTSVNGVIVASDADGDTLTYSLETSANHGVVSVESSTGKYVYIPSTNYFGNDSFVIKVDDGANPILVAVNIKVNQKPTTNAPTQNLFTKGQAVNGNANCSDPDGDTLTYSLSVDPTQGSVILDKSTGAFAYTPNSDAAGNDTFKITATDGCDDIVVTVVVHNETDVAIPSQTSDITVNQGKSTTGQLSATDADGDPLAYSVSAQPTKGTLALNENTGAWTYLANSDAKGTDSFTISVTDGNVAKSLTYNLTINTPAEFSSSSKTSVTTNQGENYTDTVSATDADGDKLTYSVVQQGSKGTVTINPDTGRYVYVPTAGAAGDDTFVLGVSDGNFTTELTVRIHIETPITVSGDTQKTETSEGDIATGSVSASDPDGDALTYSISQQGTKGNAAISNDGKWSYFASNGAGEDSFIISISDGTHTVYVTVYVHIDSKPGFDQSSSNVSVGHGQSVSGDATATDADGDVLTYTVSTQPQYGTVDLNSTTGHFTYTSLSNSVSSKDSFVVAVTDGKTMAYMTVNVTVNNAPIAQNVSVTVGQGGSKDGTDFCNGPRW